jgi:hypothetical protein
MFFNIWTNSPKLKAAVIAWQFLVIEKVAHLVSVKIISHCAQGANPTSLLYSGEMIITIIKDIALRYFSSISIEEAAQAWTTAFQLFSS